MKSQDRLNKKDLKVKPLGRQSRDQLNTRNILEVNSSHVNARDWASYIMGISSFLLK